MCSREIRLQVQGSAAAGDRFVQLPLIHESNTQDVMCIGIVGFRSRARRQQATASSSFPSSMRATPRLLCASA